MSPTWRAGWLSPSKIYLKYMIIPLSFVLAAEPQPAPLISPDIKLLLPNVLNHVS